MPAKPAETITAYKAFREDWTCRGYQYEVGKTFEHNGQVQMYWSGFHACENPFDVLSYYELVGSRFAEVEMAAVSSEKHNDSKRVSGKLTVKAELTMSDFIGKCLVGS